MPQAVTSRSKSNSLTAQARHVLSTKKQRRHDSQSISDTIKLLRSRGFEVRADGTSVKPWYLIDPRTSVHVAKWDLLLAVALCLTALVTPYEIAFLPPPLDFDRLFWFNRVIDVVFMVDMCLVCVTMTPTHNVIEGTRWIATPRELFVRYVKSGWFLIDAVALATSCFDIVAIFARGSGYLRRFKILRIMRVLKLMRLAKLLSASRLLQHWETQLLVNYGIIKLTKAVVMIFTWVHWFACLWALQAQLGESLAGLPFSTTWMADDGYCVRVRAVRDEPSATLVPPLSSRQPSWEVSDAASPLHGEWFEPPEGWTDVLSTEAVELDSADELWCCVGPFQLYSAAAYFSSMVITSIGLGDISATRRNHFEMIVATLIMLGSGILWSQVLATMTQVLATMAPADTEFHITMDDLNRFMKGYELPLDMQLRLREYFHRTKHLQLSGANRSLLLKMSPKLQGEILIHCNASWIERVAFMRGLDTEFIAARPGRTRRRTAALVLRLAPIVFAPGDSIFGTSLYIVHRGLALYGGKLLTHGMVWGEDMLLEAAHLRSNFCARALNYLEVYMISRAELMEIASHFPDTYRRLRMYVCRLALRRMIVLMTREKRHLLELRRKFPDTLGVLLDKLYGDEFRKLQARKAAGDYGGWAQEAPQDEDAVTTSGCSGGTPRAARQMSSKELEEHKRWSEHGRSTHGAIHFGTAIPSAGARGGGVGPAPPAAAAPRWAPWGGSRAHPRGSSMRVTVACFAAQAELGLAEVVTSGWQGTQGRVAHTAPLGLAEPSRSMLAGGAAAAPAGAPLCAPAGAPAGAAMQKRKPRDAKSHPGRAVEGRPAAAGASAGVVGAGGADAPLPGGSPPTVRQKHKKANNLAEVARWQSVLAAGVAPLQLELTALRQRMDAQHAAVMKALESREGEGGGGGGGSATGTTALTTDEDLSA